MAKYNEKPQAASSTVEVEPAGGSKPKKQAFATSRRPAEAGQDLHVYSSAWDGWRAGKVVTAHADAGDVEKGAAEQTVTVRVYLDPEKDKGMPSSDQLENVRVFDQVELFKRTKMSQEHGADEHAYWCEWAPV